VNVRSKLIAILIVPLLVVAFLAVSGIQERRADKSRAAHAEELVALGRAVTPLADALEREASASSDVLAIGGDAERQALAEQREATDTAIAQLQDALAAFPEDLAGPALVSALRPVRSGLGVVNTNRSTVDRAGAGATGAMRIYRQQASQLLNVVEAITHQIEDATLSRRATAWLAVSRARQAANGQHTVLAQVLRPGSGDPNALKELEALDADRRVGEGLFSSIATEDQKELWRTWVGAPTAQSAAAQRDAVMAILQASPTGAADPNAVASTAYVDALRQVEAQLGADLTARAASARAHAARDVQAYAVLATAAVLFALLTAYSVGRSITQPLRRLTKAAHQVADEQLPALVETLRTPKASGTEIELTPIERTSNDEIGEVAEAFAAIQRVTAQVAAEQGALLRKGIGDLFVNLARRNQSLLDRQIAFLDELEANETDPEDLEDLFKLDHLATRMRRNAESLLVLAGVETPRRWGRPVPVGDVIRAAISEVEDYGRIQVTGLDDVRIPGAAAADVAHLFAELLDNATQFSPPGSPVEVSGHRRSDDGDEYVVRISDNGIGMSAAQLAEANQTLAEPPLTGLALSRSLGFTVVSRLAHRYGIEVRVTATPGGGVTCVANIPAELLVADGDGSVASLEPDGVAQGPGAGPRIGPKGWTRPPDVPAAVWERITESPAASWSEPAYDPFDAPISSPAAAAPVETPEPVSAAPLDGPREHEHELAPAAATLAEALTEPVAALEEPSEPVPVVTAAGLPRRRAGASVPSGDPLLAPKVHGAPPAAHRPAAGRPPRPSFAPEHRPVATPRPNRPEPVPADGLPRRARVRGGASPLAPAASTAATASARTPEEIRSMLSAYRNGLARGRNLRTTDPSEEG